MKTFLNALLDADVEQLRAYIAEGMLVNHRCSNDKFPLHVVIERRIQLNSPQLAAKAKLLGDIQISSVKPDSFIEVQPSSFVETVKLLLEAKADVNALNEEGKTPLHVLCKVSYQRGLPKRFQTYNEQHCQIAQHIIEILLNYHPKLELVDRDGNTAFFVALLYRNEAAALLLLDKGAHVFRISQPQQNALQLAISGGLQQVIHKLLEYPAFLDPDLLNLSHDLDIKLMLLNKGFYLSVPERLQLFQAAEREEHQPMLDYLIEHGLAQDKNAQGYTALHHTRHLKTFQQLLQNDADIHAKTNEEGLTPLLSFIKWNNSQSLASDCQWLIKQGANLHACDHENQNVLHLVVLSSLFNAIDLSFLDDVIHQGISIDHQNSHGETPLHLAMAFTSDLSLCGSLLDRKADPTIRNKAGQTALEKITFDIHLKEPCSLSVILGESHSLSVITRLLHLYPVDQQPSNAQDLYKIALANDHLELAQALTQRGFNINQGDSFNPLIFMLKNSQTLDTSKLLPWLMTQKIDIHAVDLETQLTPLQYLFKHSSNFSMASYLLEQGADPHLLDGRGKTLLHLFTESWHGKHFIANGGNPFDDVKRLFERMLQQGLDVDHRDKEGRTALECSLETHSLGAEIILLLELKASFPIQPKHVDQLFWFSMRYGFLFILEQLIHVVSASDQKKYLEQTLEQALQRRHKKGIEFVFKVMNEPFVEHQDKTRWMIRMAEFLINQGDKECLTRLFEQGLDVNACLLSSYEKQTLIQYAFHEAIRAFEKNEPIETHIEIVNELIFRKCGLHFPINTYLHYLSNAQFDTCLNVAVRYGWISTVKALLEQHFPVNLESNQNTALSLAVERGDVALVNLLIDKGADVHQPLPSGKTLLHIACSKGDEPLIDLLLKDHHLDPNAEEILLGLFLMKPLNYIFGLKNPNDVKEKLATRLIEQGARVEPRMIVLAIKNHFSHEFMIQHIEKYSLLIAKPSRFLHQAVEANHLEIVVWLIDHYGTSLLDDRDDLGRTPFHVATLPGRELIFQALLQKGQFVDQEDDSGYPCSQYAWFYGTSDPLNLPFSPECDHQAFKTLRLCLQEYPELQLNDEQERLFKSAEYSYKLLCLFEQSGEADAFIQRHLVKNGPHVLQGLHDLCLFMLPRQGHWHKPSWAKLAFEHGRAVTSYLHFAPAIETLLGRAPLNLEEIKETATQVRYARASENPTWARLFITHKISETGFNHVLDHYRPKETDALPELDVEGQDLEGNRFKHVYLKKLKVDDPRGFYLGSLTHCCQSVGQAGQSCAMHGMTSPYGGFYALFKKNPKQIEKVRNLLECVQKATNFEAFIAKLPEREQRRKYRKWQEEQQLNDQEALVAQRQELTRELHTCEEGQLIAQTWAWISDRGGLVFDLWVCLRPEDDVLCVPFFEKAADKAIHQYGFTQVLLGKQGRTPADLKFQLAKEPHHPKDYVSYRDSREQLIIATQDLSIAPSKGQVSSAIHQTLLAPPHIPMLESYSVDQLDALLRSCVETCQGIHLFTPIALKAPCDQSYLLELEKRFTEIKPSDLHEKIVILPFQYPDTTHWNALFFEYCATEQNTHWTITYLYPCGYVSPPQGDRYFSGLLAKLRPSEFYYMSATYEVDPIYSGTWLVEVVRRYTQTHRLDLEPLNDKASLRLEHLNSINMNAMVLS